jgi:hypothetical protein
MVTAQTCIFVCVFAGHGGDLTIGGDGKIKRRFLPIDQETKSNEGWTRRYKPRPRVDSR